MKNKNIFCICILILIPCFVFAQFPDSEEQKASAQIRYNVDFLSEYYTIGDVVYPIAPLFEKDDIALLNILSNTESSKASIVEYSKNISIYRILSYCSLPPVAVGGAMCIYQFLNSDTPEYIYTTGLITILSGSVIEVISTFFSQKAKSHLSDAVWEFNTNINKQ